MFHVLFLSFVSSIFIDVALLLLFFRNKCGPIIIEILSDLKLYIQMLTSLMTAQVKGHLQYEQKTEIDRLPGATTNVSNLIILGGLIFFLFFRLSSIYKNKLSSIWKKLGRLPFEKKRCCLPFEKSEVVFHLKEMRSSSIHKNI